MIIYFNGQFMPFEDAHIPLDDRGFLLGDGLFETIFSNEGFIECYHEHFRRFEVCSLILKFHPPLNRTKAMEIIKELLQKNDLCHKKAVIRFSLTRGSAPRGLTIPEKSKQTFFIQVMPYSPAKTFPDAMISSYSRQTTAPLCYMKHIGGYLLPILALQEAKSYGYDEAILLNQAGKVVCGTASNIFIIRGNDVYTPCLSDGCMPGIVRGVIVKLARKEKFPLHVKAICKNDLLQADAVVLTNSLIGIQPLSRLEGKLLQTDHPLIIKLQEMFDAFRQKERENKRVHEFDLPTNYNLRIQH